MATPVLDLSRTFARLGSPAQNGIDRVERAYLREVIEQEGWGIIKTIRGFLMFEPDRLKRLPEYFDRKDLDGADQQSTIRAIASSRSSDISIRKIMWRMPNGLAYINVGQTNLNPQTMRAMMEMPDHSKIVMVHDTIPVDHPELIGEVARAKYVERLTTTINFANHIIAPSDDVAERIQRRMMGTGHRVPILVAPLGVDEVEPPEVKFPSAKPYFVALGTIEPRKNHAFLLDIWERMHSKMDEAKIPELRIIGARGPKNEELFRRLDSSPYIGRTIFELGPLPDDEMRLEMAGATGLLFPSYAEGYGLPAFEAVSLGLPVISTPLDPIETYLGDTIMYAPENDMYQWFRAIRELASEGYAEHAARRRKLREFRLPTWFKHFARVFDLIH